MKKSIIVTSTLLSGLLLINAAQAANISRTVELLPQNAKKASLKVQFSGGCTGSVNYTTDFAVRFNQRFSTAADDSVIGSSLEQALTVQQTRFTRSSVYEDTVLFSTGAVQERSQPTLLPITDASETVSETLKNNVATVTYTNKNPNVIIYQFGNNYADNLEDGPANEIGGLKKCLADYNSIGINEAFEVIFGHANFTRPQNNYLVNSAKKTNIKAKFLFTKNASTGLYTTNKSMDIKAVMGGVLVPHTGTKCSGNPSKLPMKSTCKGLTPIKYKITLAMNGDFSS